LPANRGRVSSDILTLAPDKQTGATRAFTPISWQEISKKAPALNIDLFCAYGYLSIWLQTAKLMFRSVVQLQTSMLQKKEMKFILVILLAFAGSFTANAQIG
jgi:hypothetical protein